MKPISTRDLRESMTLLVPHQALLRGKEKGIVANLKI